MFGPDVTAYPTNLDNTIIDPVAGNILNNINRFFPDLPGKVEKGIKSQFVSSDTRPEQMGLNSFKLSNNCPDIISTFRHLNFHNLLHGTGKCQRVRNTTDATDSICQMDNLHRIPTHTHPLNTTVCFTRRKICLFDDFAVHRKREETGFFKRRMNRPNRHIITDTLFTIAHSAPPFSDEG